MARITALPSEPPALPAQSNSGGGIGGGRRGPLRRWMGGRANRARASGVQASHPGDSAAAARPQRAPPYAAPPLPEQRRDGDLREIRKRRRHHAEQHDADE